LLELLDSLKAAGVDTRSSMATFTWCKSLGRVVATQFHSFRCDRVTYFLCNTRHGRWQSIWSTHHYGPQL